MKTANGKKIMASSWLEKVRNSLRELMFEKVGSPAGFVLNILIVVCVFTSIIVISIDSINSLRAQWGDILRAVEWCLTFFFTVEYLLRLFCSAQPKKYAFSFYGIVDLVSVLPSYIGLLMPGMHYLGTIRIFRILKFCQYFEEAEILFRALRASRKRITVFLFWVMTIIIVIGSLMYLVEGEENGYTSIPISIYWTVVTITTVGYGDIAPKTVLGQIIAVFVMLIGYGIVCVPTGLVASEVVKNIKTRPTRICKKCCNREIDVKAKYCKVCGVAY